MSRHRKRAPDGRRQTESSPTALLARPLPDLRREWAAPLTSFLLVFAVFVWSAPRTVTLEDSGLFIMSCHTAGISHAPGYPLHSLLGKLFTLLPIGSIAFRIHLLSALFGAATTAVLWWIARVLTGDVVLALAASIGYGVSREFWAQSIIAEVYSLNTFLFLLLFAVALAYRIDGDARRLPVAGLLLGLGLSHHWPLVALSLPAVVCLLWPRRRALLPHLPRCAAFAAAGLVPFVWMVLRSWSDPPISFIGPLDSPSRVLYFILRKGYEEVDVSATAGWSDRARFLGYFAGQVAAQQTVVGLAFAALGFAAQWRRWPREIGLALTLLFLGSSVLVVLLLRRDFTFYERAVFKVYPLLSYAALSIWIAAGIDAVRDARMRRAVHPSGIQGERPLRGFAPVAALSVVGLAVLFNAPLNVRRDDRWGRDFAETVLASLEPNAVFFTHGDVDTGTLGYLNRVEGVRPDVTIYNSRGLVFSNRLFRIPPTPAVRARALREFVERTDRPVYYNGDLEGPWGVELHPLFRRVVKSLPPGTQRTVAHPDIVDYCRRIAADTGEREIWTVGHRSAMVSNCGRALATIVRESNDVGTTEAMEVVSGAFSGKVGLLDRMAHDGDLALVSRWVDEADRQLVGDLPETHLARYFYLRSLVRARQGDTRRARDDLNRSIALHPWPDAVEERDRRRAK